MLQLLTSLSALTACSILVRAAPLGNNNGNDHSNAIDIKIPAHALPDIWEADCYAILCLGEGRVYQRVPEGEEGARQKKRNYRQSGAKDQPFRADSSRRQELGVEIPDPLFVSPEEWPPEGSTQGGRGAILFPMEQSQQSSQGGYMRTAFDRYNVGPNQWYNIVDFEGANGYWCKALRDNDLSVCRKDPPSGVMDWSKNAYQKISRGGRLQFQMVGRSGLGRRDEEFEDEHDLGWDETDDRDDIKQDVDGDKIVREGPDDVLDDDYADMDEV